MIEQKIDYPDFKQLKDQFKTLDKEVQKEIKKGIKASVGQVASRMQGEIRGMVSVDSGRPLSGMTQGGPRNRWVYPNVKSSLRLSAGPGKPVAQITAQGKGRYKRMFAITERAGSRSSGYTDEGKRMIKVLRDRYPLVKGKGGRFVFRTFLAYRARIHDKVQSEINGLANRLNVRLRGGS